MKPPKTVAERQERLKPLWAALDRLAVRRDRHLRNVADASRVRANRPAFTDEQWAEARADLADESVRSRIEGASIESIRVRRERYSRAMRVEGLVLATLRDAGKRGMTTDDLMVGVKDLLETGEKQELVGVVAALRERGHLKTERSRLPLRHELTTRGRQLVEARAGGKRPDWLHRREAADELEEQMYDLLSSLNGPLSTTQIAETVVQQRGRVRVRLESMAERGLVVRSETSAGSRSAIYWAVDAEQLAGPRL